MTALVPVYFGRVASAVIENRDLTTDRAEDSVERQAREFERLKPYLRSSTAGDGARRDAAARCRPGSSSPWPIPPPRRS